MTALRTAVNLSLGATLLAEAKQLNVNINRAAEDGLRAALTRAWQEKNAEAIASSNSYATKHGLPRAGKRPF